MKVTVAKAGDHSEFRVKAIVMFTEEEASAFPKGFGSLSKALEVCIKDHLLSGFKSTRDVPPWLRPSPRGTPATPADGDQGK